MKKELTPLEKLKYNKERVRVLSKIQENRLNANFQYLQHNSGKLIIRGITSAILPGSKSPNTAKSATHTSAFSSQIAGMALGGAADYFTKGKNILPLALSIAQPFLFTMGIKGAKKLIGNLFSGKKKN